MRTARFRIIDLNLPVLRDKGLRATTNKSFQKGNDSYFIMSLGSILEVGLAALNRALLGTHTDSIHIILAIPTIVNTGVKL